MQRGLFIFGLVILIGFLYYSAKSSEIVRYYNYNCSTKGFIENKGQLHDQNGGLRDDILYYLNQNSISVLLKKNGFSYQFTSISEDGNNIGSNVKMQINRLDVSFLGANRNAMISRTEERNDYVNYYITGENFSIEQVNVSIFNRIVYKEIYPYIDLVLYFTEDQSNKGSIGFKYSFILHSGADINDIKMEIKGADSIRLTNSDNLIINSGFGIVSDKMGQCFFRDRNKNVPIDFQLIGNIVTFKSEFSDVKETFIIDPAVDLYWGTYYGGNNMDYNNEVFTDLNQNVFILGSTMSTNNIASSGAFQTTFAGGGRDAYLVKFNSSGVRQWATYFGGSAEDRFYAGIAETGGSLIIGGWSGSSSGITTSGTHQPNFGGGSRDCILVKFTTNGSRVWSTYYGASGFDEIFSVAEDSYGNIFFAGWTDSPTGMTTSSAHQTTYGGGTFDAFLVKFNSSGVRQWATYYGGSGYDFPQGLSIDNQDYVFMTGVSSSTSGMSTSGSYQSTMGGDHDAFLVKFSSSGSRIWGTYFGGTAYERGQGIVVDKMNNVVICGWTSGSSSIATSNAHQTSFGGGTDDGFICKFNSSGSRLWSTYFGGSGTDNLYDIDINCFEYIYVTGLTASSTKIATSNGYKTSISGSQDGFFAKFDGNGKIFYSSYYGGSTNDFLLHICLDKTGYIYATGSTSSTSGIATSGSHQTTKSNSDDAFLVKFCDLPEILNNPKSQTVCLGDTLKLSAFTCSGSNFQWLKDGKALSGETDSILQIESVKFSDSGYYSCIISNYCGKDTTEFALIKIKSIPVVGLGNDTSLCKGDSIFLIVNSYGGNLLWSNSSNNDSILVFNSGKYWVKLEYNGCSGFDTINITFNDTVITSSFTDSSLCFGDTMELFSKKSGSVYLWNDNTSNNNLKVNKSGIYWVKTFNNCSIVIDSFRIIDKGTAPKFNLAGDTLLCFGDTLLLQIYSPNSSFLWSNNSKDTFLNVINNGLYWLQISNYCGKFSDSISVLFETKPEINLGNDTTICFGDTFFHAITGENLTFLWNNNSADSFYYQTDTGLIWVTAKNICGQSSDSFRLSMIYPPIVNLGNDTTFCFGSITLFTSNPGCTYHWNTGSNDSSILINLKGNYWVDVSNACFTIRDSINVIDSIFTVNLGKDTIVCKGSIIRINAGPGGYNYKWNTGSADSSIFVNKEGYYSVICSTLCGNSSDTIFVDVFDFPVVSIPDSILVCNGNKVTLNPVSVDCQQYLWSTGESTKNIKVSKSGIYWVAGSNKCGVAIDSTIAESFYKPQIDLGKDTIICNKLNLLLKISSKGDSVRWSNNSSDTFINIDKSGIYWLEVSNKCGYSIDSISVIYGNPEIHYQTQDTVICNGSFCLLSVYGNSKIKWMDGNTQNNITVFPSSKSTYKFSLTDSLGCSLVDSIIVDLLKLPLPVFNVNDSTQCLDNNVFSLRNNTDSSLQFLTFLWELSDGTIKYNWNPFTYSFSKSGSYKAKLVISYKNLCFDSAEKILVVYSQPEAKFSYLIDSCSSSVSFTNESIDGISYYWDFGDQNYSKEQNPTYFYSVQGDYKVLLNIKNDKGCEDTISDRINVTDIDLGEIFIPNAFTPNSDYLNDEFLIKSERLKCFEGELRIYNRWGEIIYNSRDNNGKLSWDGHFKGRLVPEGIYIYVYISNTMTLSGSITVLY